MHLTSEYRTVRALFEKPPGEPTYVEDVYDVDVLRSYFQVGPVSYYVSLTKYGVTCSVSFGFSEFIGTDESLVEYFSKLYKRNFSVFDLVLLKNRAKQDPNGVLRLGNSGKVFSHVLSIVRDFMGKHEELTCIRFSAVRESRQDLYRHMIKRFLPNWYVEEDEPFKGILRFLVCSPES